MSILQGAKNVRIEHSNLNVNVGMPGLQILAREIVRGARHDDAGQEEAPRCHPKTRKAIVNGILDWIDKSPSDSQILWLEGPAGAGKTAIAGTVCELLKRSGRLGGDYFLSRNGRSSTRLLFATIAYRLAMANSAVGARIEKVVANDQTIITARDDIQLKELIVDPLRVLDEDTPPFVILIDGLDECESESKERRKNEDLQCRVIQLIGSVCEEFPRLPVRFLVASRPESWISDKFSSDSISRTLLRVSLERTDATDQDIRVYYESAFQDIPVNWNDRMGAVLTSRLSKQDLDNLIDKASGQFIYPATVVKFVSDPEGRPLERLVKILAIPVVSTTPNPFADLDLLYVQILSLSLNRQRTMDVLGAILVTTSTLGSDPILAREVLAIAERLLGLPPDEGYSSLRTLHSLLHVPDPIRNRRETMTVDEYRAWLGEGPGVKFHHKSFPDFLGDKRRSGDFFVDNVLVHSRLALGCLKVLKSLSSQPESRLHYMTWDYALLFWCTHCCNSGILNSESELASALRRLDIHSCYNVVFQKTHLGGAPSGALDKIQMKLARQMNPLHQLKDTVLLRDKWEKDAGPSPSTISEAMDFIASLGGGFIFRNRLRAVLNLRTWLTSQLKPSSRLLAELDIIINGIDPNVSKPKKKTH